MCARPDSPHLEGTEPHGRHDAALHGVAAEFDTPEGILEAAKVVAAAGYTRVETYTPYSLVELPQILKYPRTRMAEIVGTGALCGGIGGFCMQYFANVIHYPWNIGGKPMNSWPMWIPITFECAILFGAISGVVGMFLLNKLPQLHHPMFNVEAFNRASKDRFWLVVEAEDPKFDEEQITKLLETTHPVDILEVPC